MEFGSDGRKSDHRIEGSSEMKMGKPVKVDDIRKLWTLATLKHSDREPYIYIMDTKMTVFYVR